MASTEGGRPAKRAKTEDSNPSADSKSKTKQKPKWQGQQIDAKRQKQQERQQRRAELDHPQPESSEHRRDRELFGIDEDMEKEIGLEPLQDEEKKKLRKMHVPKLFSQPSVMTNGDKGIFVTSDKGREKKSLTDLANLVEDYLEQHGLIPAELVDPEALLQSRLNRQQKKTATVPVDNEDSPVEEEEIDIESSINAEISGMQSTQKAQDAHPAKGAPTQIKAFQLITLDMPCVSFLRFIPGNPIFGKVDVTDIVHTICIEAAENPARMKSRFIRRLSPVPWLGKILSEGLEKACEEVLPAHFKIEEGAEGQKGAQAITSTKFAIRPTIRNNGKVSRDDVIKQVAEAVQKLGGDKHKVDLKGFEKGVLIEVYKGWVGISVVDNTNSSDANNDGHEAKKTRKYGYEALKRFNLAEIYQRGRKEETKAE